MFYEQLVLARKGPLGHVWLAAHWEKKLTKQQVSETNIPETVDRIKNPRAPMALRLSGHLLLGVVRIYYRKVDFLYTDCNDALGKIKQAFRPDKTELDDKVSNIRAITMPETITNFEVILPGDISTQQLPDIGEEMATFQLSQAMDITGQPEEIETARRSRRREAEREPSSQMEAPKLASDNDLLDPNMQMDFELEGMDLGEMGAPDLSRPEEFSPGFEGNELVAPWQEEEVAGPALTDIPALERAERLKKKRNFVDKRTELNGKAMEKLVNDPSPLYRDIRVAPGTREQIDARRNEAERGLEAMFDQPTISGLAPQLVSLLRSHMRAQIAAAEPARGALDESLSIEQARGGTTEAAPPAAYEEFGGGDMGEWQPEAPLGAEEESARERERRSERESIAELPEEAPEEIENEGKGFVITKRTGEMHKFLGKQFKEAGKGNQLSFMKIFENATRHKAAIAFFELLNIKSKGCVDVKQVGHDETSDILISKTKEFEKLTA